MCPKKIENRNRTDLDEIIETGEQRIMEKLEIEGKYYPIQAIDDECSSAVSSKFAPSNEDINRYIAALEEIDGVSNDVVDEIRKESDAVCGHGGISEKEIIEPSSEEESLPSVIDEATALQSCLREVEEELSQIDDSITELSIEDLAKLFDF